MVAIGATVQAASGVGGGFIFVPLLALINVDFVPGPIIFSSLSISCLMAWRERADIDYGNIGFIIAAMIPGVLLGAWLLSVVPADDLGVLFGSVILFAVAISFTGIQLKLNRVSGSVGGFMAGAMGASTGIGAPLLAILYQRTSGAMVRSTLAFLYTLASMLILVALALRGRFGAAEAWHGLLLVPGFMLGYLCARPLALYFDHGVTRYVVLGVSAVAAASLIVSSL